MNKAHFQTMFSSTAGIVYRFLGEVPENENPVAIITEQFIKDSGQDLMSVVVVEYSNQFVLYTDLLDVVTSDSFEIITDLVSDVIVVPVVPDTPPVEQPPEGQ